ncbi:MAG TPA: histidinol dehydrogenase, partial [Atribacterota bacterium]|nr:histidinol dehydrogenase [Atribacterota bacterium]
MDLIKILMLNDDNKAVVFDRLKKKNNEKLPAELERKVGDMIEQVKKKGNQGLLELTHRLDDNNMKLSEMEVTKGEFEEAESLVNSEMLQIIKESIKRVKSFHQNQLEKSWFSHQEEGMVLGQLIRPLERVGIYVPGGTAEYPSSLIMGAVPALIAGVKEIYVATPLGSRLKISPYLLMTARELGITKIYKVGGAQAIAALAYGTETIKPVDKIVGPGNIYVTIAKKQVFG